MTFKENKAKDQQVQSSKYVRESSKYVRAKTSKLHLFFIKQKYNKNSDQLWVLSHDLIGVL